MAEQTWKIIASPKDRWQLTVLLMHKDLKFKGKSRVQLSRFRQALGLIAPTEAFLGEKKGIFKLGNDSKTKNVFTVTVENADFLNDCLKDIELHNAQLALLEPVLNQFDAKAPSGDPEAYEPLQADEEDWSPSSPPLVDDPDRYVEINAHLLRQSGGDFKKYIELYIKEAEPPAQQEEPALKAV